MGRWNDAVDKSRVGVQEVAPARDMEVALITLQEEVSGLDEALADLIRRLGRISAPDESVERFPDYGGNTSFGADLFAIANRIADMRRTVRSYENNLGV